MYVIWCVMKAFCFKTRSGQNRTHLPLYQYQQVHKHCFICLDLIIHFKFFVIWKIMITDLDLRGNCCKHKSWKGTCYFVNGMLICQSATTAHMLQIQLKLRNWDPYKQEFQFDWHADLIGSHFWIVLCFPYLELLLVGLFKLWIHTEKCVCSQNAVQMYQTQCVSYTWCTCWYLCAWVWEYPLLTDKEKPYN